MIQIEDFYKEANPYVSDFEDALERLG